MPNNRWEILSESIRSRAHAKASVASGGGAGGVAVIPFLTAGYPTKESFVTNLLKLAPHAAAIEIGVPFSDPMADGVTIQESSRIAIANGVTLDWIFTTLASIPQPQRTALPPLVLMGYLNPFLMMGLDAVATRCGQSGIAGLIIPDLPMEEGQSFRKTLHAAGTGLIQLVSPVTPTDRAAELCRMSDGFVYAVTVTGVTGGSAASASALSPEVSQYLKRLKHDAGSTPVCAGFGISGVAQVRHLAGICDGAIVGSAVIRCLQQGQDVGAFVAALTE